jgi:hydrogenase large subunit
VNGDYQNGISVMDRHQARAHEALKVALAMRDWVGGLVPSGPVFQQHSAPASATGYGLTEAPRGALGHWVNISGGRISRYQIVTPTCWNASPKDGAMRRGPIEQALIGTPVLQMETPIEVGRVVRSFDP